MNNQIFMFLILGSVSALAYGDSGICNQLVHVENVGMLRLGNL